MGDYTAELWFRTEPTLQADFLVRRHIPGWLGDLEGREILDGGCGDGYVSRMLAKLGANVKAFDKSDNMIWLAQQLEAREPLGIEYRKLDVAQVSGSYEQNDFDVVVFSGVASEMDVETFNDGVEKLAGVLKPGGSFLIATNHLDSYLGRGESGWMRFTSEPSSGDSQEVSLEYRTPDMQNAFAGTCFFHSRMGVEEALLRTGIRVREVHEPLATEEDISHFPHMWGDEVRLPYHLVILGVK